MANFFGGLPIEQNKKVLKEDPPHIVVGTPGRMLALSNQKFLNLSTVRHFVLDECDKMLDSFGRRLPPKHLLPARRAMQYMLVHLRICLELSS